MREVVIKCQEGTLDSPDAGEESACDAPAPESVESLRATIEKYSPLFFGIRERDFLEIRGRGVMVKNSVLEDQRRGKVDGFDDDDGQEACLGQEDQGVIDHKVAEDSASYENSESQQT